MTIGKESIPGQLDAQSQDRVELRVNGYTVSDDPARIDVQAVHAFLRRAYWSPQIPLHVVARALRGSLCIGLYAPSGTQVGLCR